MFYLILKVLFKIYYKIIDLLPYENKIYIIKENTNEDITIYYYFVLLLYYININIFKTKYDILVYLKNNKRIIYNNVLLKDVIINNRIIEYRNIIKKPYLFMKISINEKIIDYNMKKLIFCHDENNTLNDIYKAYHYEKIEKIIVNNEVLNNNIQIKSLIIN